MSDSRSESQIDTEFGSLLNTTECNPLAIYGDQHRILDHLPPCVLNTVVCTTTTVSP